MKNIKLNAIIDILAALSFLFSGFSGWVLGAKLPNGGYRGGRGIAEVFLSVTRHQWLDIHNWSSWLMVVLIVFHLVLHWQWITKLPKLFKRP